MDPPEDARPNDGEKPEASDSPLKPDDLDSSPSTPDSVWGAPEHQRLNLEPWFDPALMSPVALALSESTRVSNSIQKIAADWAAVGTRIAQTNSFAVAPLAAFQSDLARLAAQPALSMRAPLSLAAGLGLFQAKPLLSPTLAGLSRDYSTSLSALARSTNDAYRIGLGLSGFESGIQASIQKMASSVSSVHCSLMSDLAEIGQTNRAWQNSIAASASRLMAASSPFADIPSFASQVRSLSSMTPSLAIASRLAGIDSPEVFAGALADRLPAAAQYAVTIKTRDASEVSVAPPAIAFVTAWVQSAMARLSIRLPPDVFLQVVFGILQLIAVIDARVSSSVATERIITAETATRHAIEEQTEMLRDRLPSEDDETHVVVSAVRLHAAPSESSTDVGEAYPNQAVRLEVVENGWCRITFEDRVASQARAGWVPAEAIRTNTSTSKPLYIDGSITSAP